LELASFLKGVAIATLWTGVPAVKPCGLMLSWHKMTAMNMPPMMALVAGATLDNAVFVCGILTDQEAEKTISLSLQFRNRFGFD